MCEGEAKVTSTQHLWNSSCFFSSISSVDNSFLFSPILDNSFLLSSTHSLSPPYPQELAKLFFQAFCSDSRFWAHYCSNILQLLITQQSLLLACSEIWWEYSSWAKENTLLAPFILDFGWRRVRKFWCERRGWELDPAEDFTAWFFPLK